MPKKLPLPTRKLDPRAFYLEYVPSLWDALIEGVERAPWRLSIGARLDAGAETLNFAMHAHGTELRVEEGRAEQPHLSFLSDVDSFRIAMFDILPRILKTVERTLGEKSPADPIEQYGASLGPDRLYDLPGTIDVHYTDDAGDEAQVTIQIASGEGPRATVCASDADLWTLIESGGRLTQLLRSRAELQGDVGYLLSVAGLVEPQSGSTG